jgi:branched-chain amino acid transport system permease protein
MYAGLAGVMMALVFQRLVPNTFGLVLSIDYLVMIVLGGLGSVRGAALGAIFVSMLPQVLDHYSDSLPLLAEPGSGGLEASQAARLLYGAAIIVVLLWAPGGLASLGRRRRKGAPTSSAESVQQRPAAPPAASVRSTSISATATELKETST